MDLLLTMVLIVALWVWAAAKGAAFFAVIFAATLAALVSLSAQAQTPEQIGETAKAVVPLFSVHASHFGWALLGATFAGFCWWIWNKYKERTLPTTPTAAIDRRKFKPATAEEIATKVIEKQNGQLVHLEERLVLMLQNQEKRLDGIDSRLKEHARKHDTLSADVNQIKGKLHCK